LNIFLKLFIIIIISAFSAISVAGQKIAQVLNVQGSGVVLVDVSRGFVKIRGWDKDQVSLKGELDDAVKEFVFKNKDDKTLIQIVTKGRHQWGDASVMQLLIPKNSRLKFKGIDTTFKLEELYNGVDGKTINGDLIIENTHKNIDVSSMSGSVKVIKSSGHARIEVVNGSIDFSGKFNDVFLESMSGNIIADVQEIDKLTIKNMSGITTIRGEIKDEARVHLKSVNGDIFYKNVGELNAECKISSQFGGKIKNMLTKDLPEISRLNQSNLSFVSGDGSGQLIINTVTGSINIEGLDGLDELEGQKRLERLKVLKAIEKDING
jgi:hypothetical protein